MSTILAVAQRGEGILTLTAAPVQNSEFGSSWLIALVDALQTSMLAKNGVGIAAPQVYVSKRVMIVASRANPRYPDAPDMAPVVMINPEILKFSDEKGCAEEGCLSVPNERGQVSRAEHILVRYYNVQGDVVEAEYSGFPARIVQHELDHLNGILFVDHFVAMNEIHLGDVN